MRLKPLTVQYYPLAEANGNAIRLYYESSGSLVSLSTVGGWHALK